MSNTIDPSAIPGLTEFFDGAKATKAKANKMTVKKPPVKAKETKTEDPADAVRPKSKVERYEERLQEFDLTMDQAMKIVDAIVTDFSWEEDIKATKKLTVRFRTRSTKASRFLNTFLQELNPQHDPAYYAAVAQANLASSLVKYGEYDLDPDTAEGFEQSLDFVNRLPQPLFQLLANKLATFDQKINTVMESGAIESF